MKLALLDYLVCPCCLGALDCKIDQIDHTLPWQEILSGMLRCLGCDREYPIKSGVPRMLVGELAAATKNTVEGFGYEWQTFDRPLQNSFATGKDIFLDFIYPADETFFKDKVVLDAGCGMGRFLKLGAEFGSKLIIGVDLSEAVNAAYRNTRSLKNAHVIQADIMALPFARKFDYIFSIGVLHHVQGPQLAFNRLVEKMARNGRISVWVYAREKNGWIIRFVTPMRKHFTSHLPRPVLYYLSRILGAALYVCLQLIYKPANQRYLGRRLKLNRLLPYNDYLYFSSRLNYPSLVMVIFDHLVPQLASYVSQSELENWFRDAGLINVSITSRNAMSWRGQGALV